ncbi:NAD-dependent epimerase/dehydratase family protein [Candidatus Parcubacteria bacterium]|jgi:UDP-glucose 4-epimerase|nr:MAG: NAD-dependent epimerase/dehydratase family protein [Candidatus Parcubacteria bacterium]
MPAKKLKKILITGGAGFIGSHLADRLLSLGHEVYALDDLSTGKFENIIHLESHKSFHYVIDSVLNKNVVGKLVDLCDEIYHLAAAVGVRTIIDKPMQSLQTNIVGTENLLEAANKKHKKIFITSTSEVYGKNGQHRAFKETDDRLQGPTYISRWGYAASKAIDEFMAFSYFRERKMPVVIARLFNIIGPRQTGLYGMVVPSFIRKALRNRPITIYGSGKQSRCFCYVVDAVEAMIKLMNSTRAVGELFNIGSEEEITIKQLAHKVKTMTNSQSKIAYISYEKAYESGFEDMMRRKPDLTKIKKYINWQPRTNLEKTLQYIIDDFKNAK